MARVFIADDETLILSLMSRALSEIFGHQVVTIAAADEILPALRRHHPDILLQDVNMPGLDLGAVMAAIRGDAELARIPVVLFSASPQEEAARSLDADAAVAKSIDFDELEALIDRLVRHGRRF